MDFKIKTQIAKEFSTHTQSIKVCIGYWTCGIQGVMLQGGQQDMKASWSISQMQGRAHWTHAKAKYNFLVGFFTMIQSPPQAHFRARTDVLTSWTLEKISNPETACLSLSSDPRFANIPQVQLKYRLPAF